MWTPDLSLYDGPVYRSIADAIAGGVRERRLKPGERLPTQRDLARQLGLTIGTITRGYAEAKRRGLVSGEVGRGTFVRRERPSAISFSFRDHTDGVIDLGMNLPVPSTSDQRLLEEIATLAQDGGLADALGYQESRGAARHRECGAEWIRRSGLAATAEEVVVTCGVQHAMLVVFATRCQPGDTVVTEALTYQGMTALARLLHLRVEGVAPDGERMRPDALEDACRRHAPTALYVQPTVHNPTASVMSETRRADIVDIAHQYDVAIVEDDTYGFLAPDAPPPLTQLAPERSYFLTALSKSLLPALRIGFVRAPRDAVQSLERAMMASTWMASPICAQIAAACIERGVADRSVESRLEETAARRDLAMRVLGTHFPDRSPGQGYHLWVTLPEPWRVEDFVAEARARDVLVMSSETFIVGRGAAPHAIRVCLGAPETRAELEKGLEVVAQLLDASPSPVRSSL